MFKLTFKDGVNIKDLKDMHHWVHSIFAELIHYCMIRDKEVVVTSLMTDQVEGRVSSSHVTGRAIDISGQDFSEAEAKTLESYLNMKFKDIGAISAKDGKVRACLWHNSGYGDHFHLQCRYE